MLAGGADWQGVHSDGTTTLGVRLPLRTDDGVAIAMRYTGPRLPEGPVYSLFELL